MFDVGFLPTAAPATQPAPLLDAAASPDALHETAAAFDAELAATLARVAGGTSRSAPDAPGGRIAHAEWFLGFTFAPAASHPAGTAAAEGATDGIAPGADEGQGEGEGLALEHAAGASEVDAPAIATPVVPADLVRPAADVRIRQQPVRVGAPLREAGDSSGGAKGMEWPLAAATPIARASEQGRQGLVPAADAAGDATPQITPSHGISASPAAARAGVPGTGAVTDTRVPASTSADAVAAGEAASTVTATAPTRADGAGPASGAARARLAAHLAHSTVQPVATASNDVPTSASESPSPFAPGTSAMLEQGAHTSTPGASVARTDVGRSEASAARGTVSMTTGGQDAAASNGDEFSQGQPRQSPEFMRFAAALAPARTGDRAAVTQALSVTPVPGTVATPPAAAVDPVAPLMPPAPADTPDAENVGRLVQAMRVSARAGAWEATVRLKPEHLGEVTIALRVDRNVVSAVVNAEAAGVRQWLQSQEQAVRSGMAEHGLQLERFLVQRDGQRHDAQPQDQQRRRPRPKPQDDAAARFEIVV